MVVSNIAIKSAILSHSLYKDFCLNMDFCSPFEPEPKIVVGVSGGKDSLALATLLYYWVEQRHGQLIVLTIDHGLREEAQKEALEVQSWCQKKSIEHHILSWEGHKPKQNIQKQAREIRFQLLEKWCQNHAVFHVCLGHHLDDQIETFWLRLERGSGVDGLSAMPMVSTRKYVRILRPLLPIASTDIAHFLEDIGQKWIEDPSNQNLNYRRNFWRDTFHQNKQLGLDSKIKIFKTTQNMGASRDLLDRETDSLIAKYLSFFPEGYLSLKKEALYLSEEICIRILKRCLMSLKGDEYPPRQSALIKLREKLLAGHTQTLARSKFYNRKNEILICREFSTIKNVQIKTFLHWDSRFLIYKKTSRDFDITSCRIVPVGPEKWTQLRKQYPFIVRAGVPSQVYWTLPRVVGVDDYECVPYLSLYKDIFEKTAEDFLCRCCYDPLIGTSTVKWSRFTFS